MTIEYSVTFQSLADAILSLDWEPMAAVEREVIERIARRERKRERARNRRESRNIGTYAGFRISGRLAGTGE